ncbi:thioredoxin-disulfide reductase [Candidatus Woesearchaeota archaeon]|nr:thioredoxin-disulfide reductase [Candidatus Woesearchaeota archaeon]|tara:strand:+ start:1767 stop:2678 length:912 start_codon:yes stop_codon:yes gene_type:complete
MENVVILGSGIAGLTAAIYNARANLKPVVVSGIKEGGQLMLTTSVENFPCFPKGILGPEMVSKAREQAKKFGARFEDGDVKKVEVKGKTFVVTTDEGKIESKAVIVATGASARMLGLESEKKYFARGVHTCATCDGIFYVGKEIVVIGGGDSAMEESLFLTKHATKVTIIHRRDSFRASKIMQERIKKNKKISVIFDSVVEEVLGDEGKVTGIKIKNVKTNEEKEMKTDAVFLSIGHIPNTKFLEGVVDLDEQGYIKTEHNMHTAVPGLFAAGDCQDRVYRQAITAAGTGCQAALEAEKYLEA